MKFYQITFTFLDPTTAVGTFQAASEEDAINNLKAQLEGQVENLEIEKIEEVVPPEQPAPTAPTPEAIH